MPNEAHISKFLEQSPLRQQIAAVFQEAGFTIARVEEQDNGSRWGFYLKLPPFLRTLFGVGREILLWVVQSADFQSRTVTQAATIIKRERPRLCEDFAIVATHDPQTKVHARETAETLDTIYLGFRITDFSQFRPWGDKDLVSALQQRLYSRDLYDVPPAVTRSEDFFGRRELVTEISIRLREGSRHVGLFGLRKIGKTSLLYRLQSVLRNADNCYVAHVDVERIDAINATAGNLLWSLGESLYDSHRHIRRVKDLLLFGKFQLYSMIDNANAVFEMFDHDMRLIIGSTSRPIVIMFDEVELLSPKAPGSMWENSFVRIWRLLRGLDQMFPNRLSYFVTGTNPSIFEENYVAERENPAYNYFSIEYLKPLVRDDVTNLLAGLGKRMGLAWQDAAIAKVFGATGGHPALVRSLASLVHRSRVQFDTRATVQYDDVSRAIDRFFVERSSQLSQIVSILGEQYPDEYVLLELVAEGRIGEFREYAETFPSHTAHLVGYGLCQPPNQCAKLEIELLQTFIQRLRRVRAPKAEVPGELGVGDMVGKYEIVASIGSSGGFGRVYSARTPDGAIVAVKVLHNGSLSNLQREIEPLQEIDHPHVVKISDYGQSEQGLVYMVMEFLGGGNLKSYCTRATRATEGQVLRWCHEILTALEVIHPNEDKVRKLRALSELSLVQLDQLEEARHGFVHRDIKPDNIMICPRGAVLIDFNISVRASSPVVTRSFTPGYLPPDGIGVEWTSDLDLYQLGLTMLQVALGVEFNDNKLDDLRTLAKEQLSDGLCKVLLKLSAPYREERFDSVAKALQQVNRLIAKQSEEAFPAT